MALDREAFMAASRGSRRYHVISLPGIGDARLQSLTQAEMRSLRRSLRDADGNPSKERLDRLDGLLVAATVVDDSGARVFSDDDALGNGLDWIDGGPWAVLCDAVRRHVGWMAEIGWKPIEDAAKN